MLVVLDGLTTKPDAASNAIALRSKQLQEKIFMVYQLWNA
jgi:bisphosphoglycerate-independent phosphoglycerate mutase (AlkP superfamily)